MCFLGVGTRLLVLVLGLLYCLILLLCVLKVFCFDVLVGAWWVHLIWGIGGWFVCWCLLGFGGLIRFIDWLIWLDFVCCFSLCVCLL